MYFRVVWLAGVDLTDAPGIRALTAYTVLMEVGPDVSGFGNASAFASWLGLCPQKPVSGGKVLYSRSRKVKNRAAIALRMGAHCLYRAKDYLGEFHRRMKWRLGKPEAVTTNAHKLARIVTGIRGEFHSLSGTGVGLAARPHVGFLSERRGRLFS